jgi:DNA-binding response OmpR family regulator
MLVATLTGRAPRRKELEQRKNILVVEDDADTAELFSEMLKVNDFEVKHCLRSSHAIKSIIQHPPDAIILDIMMPDVSGLEVLHFVRSKNDFAKIPVVVVSAKGLPRDIQEGMAAGATAYLTKPVSYSDLRKAVINALDGRQ